MELIISLIAVAIIVYFGYEFFLNKEKADGSHPLDSVTTRKEPEIEPIVAKETTQAPVQPVAPVVTPTKEENDMATKKPAPAPAKEAAPAPVKETAKAPAKKAAPAKKPKK
jgi:hypothetical protein